MFFIIQPNKTTQNTEIKQATIQYDLHPTNNKAKIISQHTPQIRNKHLILTSLKQHHLHLLNVHLFQ